ncbi:MAG: hypothetical protein D6732_07245 [Methanobacteriota archaeon]|nr:MAG: hypothetical protein D6732_07245 [Euryarchaeota archaeon]
MSEKSIARPRIWYVLEIIGVIYVLSPFIISNIIGIDPFLGIAAEVWRIHFLASTVVGIVSAILLAYVIGWNDFRSRLVFHFLIIAAVTSVTYISFAETVGSLTTDGVITYLILLLFMFLGGLGAFFNMLHDVDMHLRNVDRISTALKEGRYSVRITDPNSLKDRTFGKIINALNEAIDLTGKLVENLNATNEIISAANELSSVSDEISASSEEVASSSQSMSDVANQQAQHVQEIVDKLQYLDQAITNIISQIQENSEVVSQIALQTNILALNAGIEASRAGDYGRGFAVVAENVRRLSDESKKAAENIISVSDVVTQTLKSAFDDIRFKIEEVSALSEETAASSEEVASTSEEMSSAMEELSASANELKQIVDRIEAFIRENELDHLLK